MVAPHLLVQPPHFDCVQIRQIAIQHDAFTTNHVDDLLDLFGLDDGNRGCRLAFRWFLLGHVTQCSADVFWKRNSSLAFFHQPM